MNLLEELMPFRLLIQVIQIKQLTNQKKILDHDYVKMLLHKLESENFAVRLKEAKLAAKKDIADFIKKEDSNKKLKNTNKKVNSNKTRHIGLQIIQQKKFFFGQNVFTGNNG